MIPPCMARLTVALCLALWSVLSAKQAIGQTFEQDRVIAALSMRVLAFAEGVGDGSEGKVGVIGVFEDEELYVEFQEFFQLS